MSKIIRKVLIGFSLFLVVIVIATNILRCDHENVKTVFSFDAYDSSAAYNYSNVICADCNETLKQTLFHKTPNDSSYLTVFEEQNNGNEINGGEYYTIRGIVAFKFYDPTSSSKIRIRCKVEANGVIVIFNVEFREKFREKVKILEEGDNVVFYGKYYDVGCGFTDAKLIAG